MLNLRLAGMVGKLNLHIVNSHALSFCHRFWGFMQEKLLSSCLDYLCLQR